MMKVVFWLSLAVVNYTYWGYPVLLALLAKARPKPVLKRDYEPRASIVIAVRNEAARLPAKLENLRSLHYPSELLQIIVVSDGSSDDTENILRDNGSWLTPVLLESRGGKAIALNKALELATGEIVVFFDVRQTVHLDAIKELASCFADPNVGAVSGELHLKTSSGDSATQGLGMYWKLEKLIRRLESESGSVVGVTGAIYALRRELFGQMPEGILLDDVLIPMQAARTGARVIFEPRAIAEDVLFDQPGKEFARKVRTLSGNYQLLQRAPWLLSTDNPLLFRFVCHKVLRLLVPLFLLASLASSALARTAFYESLFIVQLLFYGLALLGLSPRVRRVRVINLAYTFVSLNTAALVAFWNFVRRKQNIWQPS